MTGTHWLHRLLTVRRYIVRHSVATTLPSNLHLTPTAKEKEVEEVKYLFAMQNNTQLSKQRAVIVSKRASTLAARAT